MSELELNRRAEADGAQVNPDGSVARGDNLHPTHRGRFMTDIASHYLEEAGRQFRGHKRMAEGAMSQLRDEDFFVTLDPELDSGS